MYFLFYLQGCEDPKGAIAALGNGSRLVPLWRSASHHVGLARRAEKDCPCPVFYRSRSEFLGSSTVCFLSNPRLPCVRRPTVQRDCTPWSGCATITVWTTASALLLIMVSARFSALQKVKRAISIGVLSSNRSDR